jgi:uncharacterized membrane protein YfcA
MLGQFSQENLVCALVLVPLAPVGVRIGHYLVKISDPVFYYKVISFFLMIVGVKLLWEGVAGL